MNITVKKLAELHKPTHNIRRHSDKQITEYIRSIEMFGQVKPLVVAEDGEIIAGNGLYEALLRMGRETCDCYVMVGLIERKRNFAAPSTIYVKLPNGRNNDQLSAEKQAERKAGKPDEREPENRLTDSRKTGPCTAGKPDMLYKEGTTVLNYRSSSKAATAASRTDSDLAEIVQHFQQVIGDFPRSALDKLQNYREVFPKELICRAFDEAAESGVRNWRYIDGILRDWQADGVCTLGDVEARREARRKPEPPQEKKMEVLT